MRYRLAGVLAVGDDEVAEAVVRALHAVEVRDIIGSPVSPLNVAHSGVRHLHAVWNGLGYVDTTTNVSIRPPDGPVVCSGDAEHLLRYTEGGAWPVPP